MVGWMDDEALRRTLTTGRATYWSRSRQEYWRKGDTSGHVQHVRAAAWTATVTRCCCPWTRSVRPATPGARTCFDAGATAAVGPARHDARGQLPHLPGHDLAGPRGLPRAGPRPPGHPGRPPPAGRRRDADRALPQAGAGPARDLPARVGRARGLVALLVRRRPLARRPDRARRRGLWIGEPPVGVPTAGDPLEALRRTVATLRTQAFEGCRR